MIDLQLDNVSKRYRICHEDETSHAGILRKVTSYKGRGQDFWALRHANLQVARGETLGIIGHNGSGKSTILKLLSSITAPTEGEITIRGRIAALLEVSSGFHPELTGRENIFLMGSIVGMRRHEIRAKLDRILEFAGIRPFIDLPIKRYSSGMLVRLGFSIAAHLEPDILLLDEVLAVGDMEFQQKCIEHVLGLKRSGMTIVFISHDLAAVERLCDRAILLRQGQIVQEGAVGSLTAQYLMHIEPRVEVPDPAGRSLVALKPVQFLDAEGRPTLRFRTGYPLRAVLGYEVSGAAPPAAIFSLCFFDLDTRLQCEFRTTPDAGLLKLQPGLGAIEFLCEAIGLQPGIYHSDARAERPDGSPLQWLQNGGLIYVEPGKPMRGSFYAPHTWRAVDLPASRDMLSVEGREHPVR